MFRKKGSKSLPAVSTASLPDIVFMLLFFFMVSTKMKEITLKVEVKKPNASAAAKLEDESLVKTVYIGKPTAELRAQFGTEPRIQLNDVLANDVSDLDAAVQDWRNEINEAERLKMTINLKIDKETKMGIVTDVKDRLREVNALKISYSSMKAKE
ncbi:MAG: biopolymer transporter ExbD [Flavobacteriales bacterium]|nr:biopolymer transporter ExbD [Flavobacteriales bacterium]